MTDQGILDYMRSSKSAKQWDKRRRNVLKLRRGELPKFWWSLTKCEDGFLHWTWMLPGFKLT